MDFGDDFVDVILNEVGWFVFEEIVLMNSVVDKYGIFFVNGEVMMLLGWCDFYYVWIFGGWNGLLVDLEFGG